MKIQDHLTWKESTEEVWKCCEKEPPPENAIVKLRWYLGTETIEGSFRYQHGEYWDLDCNQPILSRLDDDKCLYEWSEL